MKIKNLNFGQFVFGQSGVQGFFAESDEYPYHAWYQFIPGFSFSGMSFVAKTITLKPRVYPESSNTELRDGYKIKRFFPKSIWWSISSILRGYLLNAVGLANPGAQKMLTYQKWQQRHDVFQISFMPMETSREEKVEETRQFCTLLRRAMPFHRKFLSYGIQVNLSCPNTGHGDTQDPGDAIAVLSVFREMLPDVPLIPKFDLTIKPETISKIKPYCDAFCISNTLAFGKMMSESWWKKLFRKGTSPLLKNFGGKFSGGLSGAPLFPLLIHWLKKMEEHDPTVVIIAGGGIMKKDDIRQLVQFDCVQGIALGSVAILRPWRLRSLIKFGNKIFSKSQKK